MKKFEYLKLHPRKFLFFFLLIYFLILSLMELNFFWDTLFKVEKKFGNNSTKIIYDFHNNVDLIKKIKSIGFSDSDKLSLSLSKTKLSELMDQVELFKKIGYQDDEIKKWFNAEMVLGGEKYKSKLKLHGTSSTWLKRDFLSFKVKQEKNTQYPFNIRRFNLINVQDKFLSQSDPLNKFAADFGLIAPSGELKNLTFNGTDMGMFYLVEDHKKEFLERNFGIVDYVMFSPLDNWVGTSYGHVSPHDLSYFYYEASGYSDEYSLGLARAQLKLLFSAVKSQDYDLLESLIDKDYMSKFLALMYLFNDIHLVTGDNLRFIYDFHRGNFYPLFRLENLPSKFEVKRNVDFNKMLFENYDFSPTHDFFSFLIQDDSIRFKRDEYLWGLVNNKNNIVDAIQKKYAISRDILLSSSISRQRYKLFERNLINNLHSNINFIESYLKNASLYILNEDVTYYVSDSMVPIRNVTTNLQINNSLDLDLNPNFKKKKAKINIDCDEIEKFQFINDVTNEKLVSSKVKCINTINNKNEGNWKSYFDDFDVNYIYDSANNSIEIKEGTYHITRNIVFDFGLNIKLNPGVNLILSNGKSIQVNGKFTSIGYKNKPINIRSEGNIPFGTIAIHSNGLTEIKYTTIENGSEAILNGVKYSGQMSVNGGEVLITKSKFINSKGDDGLNIKKAKFNISDSVFFGNISDQVDIDFCNGVIETSLFEPSLRNEDGDGIDLSKSNVIVRSNTVMENGDKGISVGEASNIYLKDNIFKNNNTAIAVKDGSSLFLDNNFFKSDNSIISIYKKKGFYSEPKVVTSKSGKNNISFNFDGDGEYIERIEDVYNSFQLVY